MKLILTQEVSGLGAPGDVVEVKDGYGRNFLLPRGLAAAWTRGGEKQVATIRKARAARAIQSIEEAQQVKAALEAAPVRLSARAGASGRLFGAVTPADVAEAVRAVGGRAVDRRKIELPQVIKAVGDYTVHVRLHPDVRADLRVQVVAAS
jgi:large subunit ribosomal protein L9